MIKQFLIQVIPDESTRVFAEDDKLVAELECWCQSYFTTWTTGPIPRVHVIGLNPDQAMALLRAHVNSKLKGV